MAMRYLLLTCTVCRTCENVLFVLSPRLRLPSPSQHTAPPTPHCTHQPRPTNTNTYSEPIKIVGCLLYRNLQFVLCLCLRFSFSNYIGSSLRVYRNLPVGMICNLAGFLAGARARTVTSDLWRPASLNSWVPGYRRSAAGAGGGSLDVTLH